MGLWSEKTALLPSGLQVPFPSGVAPSGGLPCGVPMCRGSVARHAEGVRVRVKLTAFQPQVVCAGG